MTYITRARAVLLCLADLKPAFQAIHNPFGSLTRQPTQLAHLINRMKRRGPTVFNQGSTCIWSWFSFYQNLTHTPRVNILTIMAKNDWKGMYTWYSRNPVLCDGCTEVRSHTSMRPECVETWYLYTLLWFAMTALKCVPTRVCALNVWKHYIRALL